MQLLLAIAYIAARWARDVVWAIQRPHLRGVRVVVVDPHGAVLLVRHGPEQAADRRHEDALARTGTLLRKLPRPVSELAGILG